MADGIAAGGASVGDDGDWPIDAQCVQNHSPLDLRLVMNGSSGLLLLPARRSRRLAVIGLSERHTPRRGAQDQGHVIGRLPLSLLPGATRRLQEHRTGAVEAGHLAAAQAGGRQGVW